jgi:hypothetical protein
MRDLNTRAWAGRLGLFAVLASAAPARGQSPAVPPWAGFYLQKDAATGAESLVRLESVSVPNSEGRWVVATMLKSDGSYQVLAGMTERGGLNVPLVFLEEVRRPYALLQRPALLLQNPAANLIGGSECQITLIPSPSGMLDYGCRDDSGPTFSSGSLVRIRP